MDGKEVVLSYKLWLDNIYQVRGAVHRISINCFKFRVGPRVIASLSTVH